MTPLSLPFASSEIFLLAPIVGPILCFWKRDDLRRERGPTGTSQSARRGWRECSQEDFGEAMRHSKAGSHKTWGRSFLQNEAGVRSRPCVQQKNRLFLKLSLLASCEAACQAPAKRRFCKKS